MPRPPSPSSSPRPPSPPRPRSASAPTRRGYWAFADRMQARIDRYWDDAGRPLLGLQLGRALRRAAHARGRRQRDHHGPARNDRRARRLVDALVASPPFVATAPPRWKDAQTHAPGFVASMHTRRSNQHLVVDSEVIDGLRYAWLARRELGLSDAQARAIADRIHRTAMGSYWRWPTIRLNQINWYALVYAANATVTGSPRLLRHDLRLQIERFVARARGRRGRRRQPRRRAALQLPAAHAADRADEHRLRRVREHHRLLHARVRPGPPGRHAARRRPPPARLMRAVADARAGGLLDPRRLRELGHGLRLPALAPGQEARAQPAGADRHRDGAGARAAPGRARVGEVDARPRLRALRAPARARRRRAARPVLRRPRAPAAGRERAAGARADDLQRGARRSPPGSARRAPKSRRRCTRSTPTPAGWRSRRPTTTPRSCRAAAARIPYGGIDLARLYDGRQEVAAGIGGRPPASFGLLVRDISGRRTFATQLPDRGRLRLTQAPHGVRAAPPRGRAAHTRARSRTCARPGSRRGRGWLGAHEPSLHVTSSCRRPGRCGGRARSGRASVDVLFPSWGAGAEVTLVLRDGTTRRSARSVSRCGRVAHLRVTSRHGALRGAAADPPARRDRAPAAPAPAELGAARRPDARGPARARRAGARRALQRPLRARGTRTGRGDRGPPGQ